MCIRDRVEGDPENVDAQYRTEYSVKALTDAGLEVECLSDQVGNSQQDQAQQIVANALGQDVYKRQMQRAPDSTCLIRCG